jgi:hypothetical protein
MDNAFNTQGASLDASIANPNAEIAAQITGTGETSSVPEPTMLSALLMGGIGLLGRRRTASPRFQHVH